VALPQPLELALTETRVHAVEPALRATALAPALLVRPPPSISSPA
jgi:hypothetical protein